MLKVTSRKDNVIYIRNENESKNSLIREDIIDFYLDDIIDEDDFTIEDELIEDLIVNNEGYVPNKFLESYMQYLSSKDVFMEDMINESCDTPVVHMSVTVPCEGMNVIYSPVLCSYIKSSIGVAIED